MQRDADKPKRPPSDYNIWMKWKLMHLRVSGPYRSISM